MSEPRNEVRPSEPLAGSQAGLNGPGGSPPLGSGRVSRRAWQDGDWIDCPRCEKQTHDVGSCSLCGNLGVLDANGERFHCDCRADDWVEGDNDAIRCSTCGGYAGEPGTSIRLTGVTL